MRDPLYVDLQAAQNPSHAGRGITRYSIEFTRALIGAGAPLAGIALSAYHPSVTLPDDLVAGAPVVTRSAAALRTLVGDQPFSYLLTSPMELDLPPSRTLSATALVGADTTVAVLYDLIPLLFPDRYLVSPRSRATYDARLELLRDVDLLLALLEQTRRDAVEHLDVAPERVAVIGGGASDDFRLPASPAEPERILASEVPQLRGPFVLTVAAWEWRKNLETLVRAVGAIDPALRRGRQLVVVCSGLPPGTTTWHDAASAAGLDDDQFVVVGPVSDTVLRALYQACELFVLPSRYEGFGLPVVEAAVCGAPVVTASTSSLPEILRLPAATFDPEDHRAMAAVIERGLTDQAFREELLDAATRAAATHTWAEVGRRTVEAWPETDGSRPVPRTLAPPRIVWLGSSTDTTLAEIRCAAPESVVDAFEPGTAPRAAPRLHAGAVYPLEALERILDPLDYDVLVWDTAACGADSLAATIASVHPASLAVTPDSADQLAGLERLLTPSPRIS